MDEHAHDGDVDADCREGGGEITALANAPDLPPESEEKASEDEDEPDEQQDRCDEAADGDTDDAQQERDGGKRRPAIERFRAGVDVDRDEKRHSGGDGGGDRERGQS